MSKSEKKDNSTRNKALASAAGAVAVGSAAPSRIMGYHNVYHGNSSRRDVDSIRKTGLKTSKGGTGVSVADERLGRKGAIADSKNKVFFSKKKAYALSYTKDILGDHDFGRVVKAKIPHKQYVKAKEDGLVRKITENEHKNKTFKKDHFKSTAATSNHGIPSSRIVGGEGYKGRSQFATKKNMKRYLGTASGKARFARGVGAALGSAGLAGYSASKVKELVNKSKAS